MPSCLFNDFRLIAYTTHQAVQSVGSTSVYAYWVFDRNDKLLDILIYKETDAL